jgi:hypothetical protein
LGDFPCVTNNVRPALGGAAAATRSRHGLDVEEEGHLKEFIVILVFIEVFCTIHCFLMPKSQSQKKIQLN